MLHTDSHDNAHALLVCMLHTDAMTMALLLVDGLCVLIQPTDLEC